jgi:hypothetical protein
MPMGSAGIPHPCGYTVDRHHQGPASWSVGQMPKAPQQLDLHEVQRVHVRVPNIDGSSDHGRGLEQLTMTGNLEDSSNRPLQARA